MKVNRWLSAIGLELISALFVLVLSFSVTNHLVKYGDIIQFNFGRQSLIKVISGCPRHLLESVMDNPQQIVVEKENLKAYQSVVSVEEKDPFLLRIIVNDAVEPAMVVTA